MIEFATAVAPPPATGVVTPPGSTAGGDFARALAGLGDAAATPPALIRLLDKGSATAPASDVSPPVDLTLPTPPGLADVDPRVELPPAPALPGKRQAVAEDGKTLPADRTDDDRSKDVIWLPIGLIPIVPLDPPPALPKFAAPVTPVVGASTPAPQGSPVQAASPPGQAVAEPPRLPEQIPPSAGDVVGIAVATNTEGPAKQGLPVAIGRLPDAPRADLPIRIDAAATSAPPAVAAAQQPAAPVTQPAGQAFAAAIAAAVQSRRDTREPGDTRTPTGIAMASLEAIHKPAAAAAPAAAETQHGALDLRQDHGLQGMIDRIETLRDDADARDTRIRLVPDALGAVDVSVRKDGDRVHVHFAAENQASARLLSDAQPRLADLAEARGVRLGQTTVGAGIDSGGGQPRQQRPAPVPPAAPVSRRGVETTDRTDHRIA